jgi:8-oxo-dGTP pyrophosphatase MutT (NUDIX family)
MPESLVEDPTTGLNDSSPQSSNPNPAHIEPKEKRPIDVAAFDKAMTCISSSNFSICAGSLTCKGSGDDRRVLVILNEKYTQDLWQLPKGRKNIGENSLCATAVRETYEETGYTVQLLAKDISTRATMADGSQGDGPIFIAQTPEPVVLIHYNEPGPGLDGPPVTKVCFFYVATLGGDQVAAVNTQDPGESLTHYWLTCADAMKKLTFRAERMALKVAISYWQRGEGGESGESGESVAK